MSEVHLIYNGRTEDIDLNDLFPNDRRTELGIEEDIELSPDSINAEQIKKALVHHFDQPETEFNELVVEHHKNGNITVRPNATFGITQT